LRKFCSIRCRWWFWLIRLGKRRMGIIYLTIQTLTIKRWRSRECDPSTITVASSQGTYIVDKNRTTRARVS
jgi:hypothetical protein